ncbi:MAG TPA: hypothetical protein VHA12_00595 [Candidatus Nanoarchaeia archaeon]|nr:hypothetical protein [Candidatus Nanoarchaeia archaeon]
MNNKGNIAFAFLPLIALIACTFAALSYLNLDDNYAAASMNISKMSTDVNVMQQYIESSSSLIIEDFIKQGFTPDVLRQSAEKRDLHLEGQGNFFSKIENGEFKITRNGNKVILEVEGVFVQSRAGESIWKREWNLNTEATINGEFTRFINK